MPFRNRSEAGRKLAVALAGYKDQQPVVLALPRGGVLVAAEVAGALEAPLDLILVRKVGVPFQPELAMGAVVDGGAAIVVRNEDVIAHAGIEDAEFTAACESELAEIERRREPYLGNSEGERVTVSKGASKAAQVDKANLPRKPSERVTAKSTGKSSTAKPRGGRK